MAGNSKLLQIGALIGIGFLSGPTGYAQSPTEQDAQREELKNQKQQIEDLKRELQEIKESQRAMKAQIDDAAPPGPTVAATNVTPDSRATAVQYPAPIADIAPAVEAVPQVSRPSVTGITREPPPGLVSVLSVRVHGVDAGLYGFVDASFDHADNGVQSINQVSSNESFVGIAGGVDLNSPRYRVIFQVETMVEVASTPGVGSSFGSRNSFVGFATPYGSFKWGKYDTPYKRGTAEMNPFKGSLGDYNSIMGNSAGEGRAEFDYRMPHSVFYDSPDFYGFTVNLLYSPGQKLNDLQAASNDAFPQGELVCSGAQQPSLNGATPNAMGTQTLCNDGAFKDAYSASLNYLNGPLYVTAGWEVHKSVNRESDKGGVIATESAAKLGVSYHLPFDNQLSAIYEQLFRHDVVAASNERQRHGYYLSDIQDLGAGFDFMAAYAHAGETPGSPKFPGLPDAANLYAIGPKYHFNDHASLYLVGAYLTQGAGAHYGLGAGEGHGAAVLSPRTQTGGPLPGKSLDAVSIGAQLGF